jgi:hypothetical protein
LPAEALQPQPNRALACHYFNPRRRAMPALEANAASAGLVPPAGVAMQHAYRVPMTTAMARLRSPAGTTRRQACWLLGPPRPHHTAYSQSVEACGASANKAAAVLGAPSRCARPASRIGLARPNPPAHRCGSDRHRQYLCPKHLSPHTSGRRQLKRWQRLALPLAPANKAANLNAASNGWAASNVSS